MASKPDLARLQEELVDAFEWNEDERLDALVAQLVEHPREARALLDEMLGSDDASVRRPAVFALGELGGVASVRRLEQQMAVEEARNDYDGESVLEVITQALGRIKETGARASLIRRFKRLLSGKPGHIDISDMAYALWRKRHPELIPLVRSALEQLPSKDGWALRALLHLLETSPEALVTWAQDGSVSPALKANVLAILDEEVPDELFPVMRAFVSAASALGDEVKQRGEASEYCDRLFTTLLLHAQRVLPTFPAEVRSELRSLARRCVESVDASCRRRAVWMLDHVGLPEDAALIDAHRPEDPGLADDYIEIAQKLRKLPTT